MPNKAFRIDKTGRMVSFLGVKIPARLANIVFVRKIRQSDTWYLASEGRRGEILAAFDSEQALEDWWQAYQEHRGGGWLDLVSKLTTQPPEETRE